MPDAGTRVQTGTSKTHVASDVAKPVIGGDDPRSLRPAHITHVRPWVDAFVQKLGHVVPEVLQPMGDGPMQVRINEGLPSLTRIVPGDASGTECLSRKVDQFDEADLRRRSHGFHGMPV